VSSDTSPPAEPTPIAVLHSDADPTATLDRLVDHPLDEPIVLEEGQHLYVAVEMVREAFTGNILCVSACDNEAAEADRNYWSNAATPPYSWATLSSFGINVNAELFALGFVEP
jgi:hypothetical protein